MTDINGAWLGTYWQEGLPTRFEATLAQGGNTLSGVILDDSYLGEAQITGEVIGRSIRFTKRYLTSSPTIVQYTGTIAEDGDSMQGKWTIGRRASGTWEAHRNSNDLMKELQNRMAQQVPAGAV